MKRDYPDRPFVGVGAVIVQDGRAVVVKRGGEPRRGEWSIPGGLVELGETLREGAAREALEETGLQVDPGPVLEVFDSIMRDPDGKTQYHYVLIDFLCHVLGGKLRAGSDAAEVRWVTPEQLAELKLTESAAQVIRKGLEESSETW